MMTQTNEYTEYRINKELKLTIWNDKKLSISLLEDTVDLDPWEVKELHRITSRYKARYGNLWEQKQEPNDCLKCKYIQKIPQQQIGLPLNTAYTCLKNKYNDKMSHPNHYCNAYEEKKED